MEGPWLVSYIILWILALAMALLALSHSRLLGMLHQRIGPPPPRSLTDRLVVGSNIQSVYGVTLLDQPWRHDFTGGVGLIGIFLSPQCSTCNGLLPHLRDFAKQEGRNVHLVVFSVLADLGMNQAYARFAQLDTILYVIAERFAAEYEVPATPYAISISGTGQILAKGVVNNYEHLLHLTASQAASSKAQGAPR